MDMLPLEKVFEKLAADRSNFPVATTDYCLQYKWLVQHLTSNIYRHIDAGLAVNTPEHGFYTAHDKEHFDDVILYAGELLGVKTGTEDISLTPYELYVLLVAIRVHDVGNIYGRLEHEKRCFSVLKECGHVSGEDDTEKKIIGSIAEAHGGRTANGDKDTIGVLPREEGIGRHKLRSQLIASIVRFSDEICENRRRAATYLQEHGNLPKHSELFHQYAASITENTVDLVAHRINIRYTVNIKNTVRAFGCAIAGDKTESFIIDEIFERLEKMDRERRYCNRFSRDIFMIDAIRATINIVDDDCEVLHQIQVPELFDYGYPEDNSSRLKTKLSKYCGPEFWSALAKEKIQ